MSFTDECGIICEGNRFGINLESRTFYLPFELCGVVYIDSSGNENRFETLTAHYDEDFNFMSEFISDTRDFDLDFIYAQDKDYTGNVPECSLKVGSVTGATSDVRISESTNSGGCPNDVRTTRTDEFYRANTEADGDAFAGNTRVVFDRDTTLTDVRVTYNSVEDTCETDTEETNTSATLLFNDSYIGPHVHDSLWTEMIADGKLIRADFEFTDSSNENGATSSQNTTYRLDNPVEWMPEDTSGLATKVNDVPDNEDLFDIADYPGLLLSEQPVAASIPTAYTNLQNKWKGQAQKSIVQLSAGGNVDFIGRYVEVEVGIWRRTWFEGIPLIDFSFFQNNSPDEVITRVSSTVGPANYSSATGSQQEYDDGLWDIGDEIRIDAPSTLQEVYINVIRFRNTRDGPWKYVTEIDPYFQQVGIPGN